MKKLIRKERNVAIAVIVLGAIVGYFVISNISSPSAATYASPVAAENISDLSCYVRSVQVSAADNATQAIQAAKWKFHLSPISAPFKYNYAYLEIPSDDSYYNPKPRIDGKATVITAEIRKIVDKQLYGDNDFYMLSINPGQDVSAVHFDIPLGLIPSGAAQQYVLINTEAGQRNITRPDNINLFNVAIKNTATGALKVVKTATVHIVR